MRNPSHFSKHQTNGPLSSYSPREVGSNRISVQLCILCFLGSVRNVQGKSIEIQDYVIGSSCMPHIFIPQLVLKRTVALPMLFLHGCRRMRQGNLYISSDPAVYQILVSHLTLLYFSLPTCKMAVIMLLLLEKTFWGLQYNEKSMDT